jgi:tetratricopeptide (TPR) repeat protein
MTCSRTRLAAWNWGWCLTALAAGSLARAAPAGPSAAPEAVLSQAAAAEVAGRTNEAVEAYERLLASDSSYELIAAPRLVRLYAGAGDARQALSWAARIAPRQPQPKAYLSGVYGLLGQLPEAELLLREAARDERDERQRAQLLWQLAEVQERRGDRANALGTLARARASTSDASLLATTDQRLRDLRGRDASTRQPATPNARPQQKAEETP